MSLPFHKQVCAELLADDGLAVMGKGLGLYDIVMRFIKLYCTQKHLVFVLNLSTERQLQICCELQADGVKKLPSIISDSTSTERAKVYNQGGVVFVSSTVLALDLLRKNLRTHCVAGFLVTQAHRVTEGSQEHFILSLYRESNKTGFIKAFTEEVPRLTGSYNKIEHILASLYVKNLYLWPRFHVAVSEILDKRSPEVIELHIPLSASMKKIQSAVIKLIDCCLTDLKENCPQLDATDLSLENGIFKHFDEMIRRQLDPIWLSIPPRTKQIVNDLKSLRAICTNLISQDCVRFNRSLEWMRVNELGPHSDWIYEPSADTLFTATKARVFFMKEANVKRKKSASPVSSPGDSTEVKVPVTKKYSLVLEENPKWKQVKDTLDEIEAMDHDSPPRILIIVQDIPTCILLREYLLHGGIFMLQSRWNHYLSRKSYFKANAIRNSSSSYSRYFKSKSKKGQTSAAAPAKKRKRRSTSAQTSIIDLLTKPKKEDTLPPKISDPIDILDNTGNEETKNAAPLIPKEEKVEMPVLQEVKPEAKNREVLVSEAKNREMLVPKKEEFECFEIVEGTQVIIQPYGNEKILDEVAPHFVIMYDPNLGFIRQLEVYQATKQNVKIRIYFLLYENSVEEQQYLSSLQKENYSFELLVRSKENLVVPELLVTRNEEIEIIASTREGGRRNSKESRTSGTILVDIREFRSKLPSSLYYKGFTISPLTLEVGDYILSPNICVERKSISDLFSSFQSGRLFTQAEAMCKMYNTPILLIEFSANKSFALVDRDRLEGPIQPSHIISRLCLLILHFPSLRLLWSRHEKATGTLFEDLKKEEDEPVPIEKEFDALEDTDPVEFLRRLPGITPGNVSKVINQVENLHELSQFSKPKLVSLLGAHNGGKLFTFFNQRYDS